MKKILFVFVVVGVLFSCKKDEGGDKSNETVIKSFDILSSTSDVLQNEQVVLDDNYAEIHILQTSAINNSIFPITVTPVIEIADGATISPASKKAIVFNSKEDAVKYIVTAEDGTVQEWYSTLRDNQIPNSDFENWFTTKGINGKAFNEPGKSLEATVWGTANMGTSIYSQYGTIELVEEDNSLVKIFTDSTSAVPVTSGTLFLGKFDIEGAFNNPTDPEQATDFGIPFVLRPSAIKFKYNYTAGDILKRFTLKNTDDLLGGFLPGVVLNGSDECKIYAFLEVRNGDSVKEIARVEFTDDGKTSNVLTEKTLSLNYTDTDTPTHISIVFASSKDGDKYTGAVGSTLIIDDLELLYD